MNILVIAGSPKGEVSVTRQYVRALEARFPGHAWSTADVAIRSGSLERDRAAFDAVMEQVRAADVVLWACPVYVLLVPAGLKRFIELVHERGAAAGFQGKYAASLTTSIHFHDNCAHDYLRAVSEDLGMAFVAAFSPGMYDLLQPGGMDLLVGFWRQVLRSAEQRLAVPRWHPPLERRDWRYEPGPRPDQVAAGGRRIVILHDAPDGPSRLRTMVERLVQRFAAPVETINLREQRILGNCLGCLRCGSENHCAYEGKDDFVEMYNRSLKQADLLLFAGTVTDRHLSARWRQFFERSFFNTHQPSFAGKQLAFLVSGPLGQMANLREILVGYGQWQEANLVDIVSDECEDSGRLDAQIDALAARMMLAAEDGYVRPYDFQGIGGRLVFRDHIFGHLRPVFAADHRYYARTGFYQFPTWKWGERIINQALLLAFRSRRIRRVFDRHVTAGMLRPFARLQALPFRPANPGCS
jgi:multimeric flavodoxin WrbA